MSFRHACNVVNCLWWGQKCVSSTSTSLHTVWYCLFSTPLQSTSCCFFSPRLGAACLFLFMFYSVVVAFLFFFFPSSRCRLLFFFFFFLPLTFLPFISSQHDIQSFLCFIHLSPSVVVFFSSPLCLDTKQRQFEAGGLSCTVMLTLC